MSDQEPAPMHEWQHVDTTSGSGFTTYRMKVPGGWLYRVVAATKNTLMTVTFVPDSLDRPVFEEPGLEKE